MRSPFSIFRKYQKTAMVIILVLIMFVFVASDALSTGSGGTTSTFLTVMMVGIMGAAVGALIGTQTGKPWEYAIAGIVVGGVVSFIMSNVSGSDAAVETTVGSLTPQEIDKLVARRQTANSFVTEAFRRVADLPHPSLQQYLQNYLQRFTFSNGLEVSGGRPELERQSLEDDVLLGHLLEREADKMGIEISDEAVNAFIKSIGFSFGPSKRQLTREELQEIRDRLNVGTTQLYDALRGELRVRLARDTLVPQTLPSPQEYWKVYRQLNVRQRLDVAAVPVAEFAKAASEPTQAEVEAFFELYKMAPPSNGGSETPGFLQPRKFQLAYVAADFEEFEKKVAAVTDAEIEEHYNKNKESYKKNPFPESPEKKDDTKPGPELEAPLDVEVMPEEKATTPGDTEEENKTDESAPDSEKPVQAPDAPSGASEEKTDASQPADDSKSADDKSQPPAEPDSAPDKGASIERKPRQPTSALPALLDSATVLLSILTEEGASDAGKQEADKSATGADAKDTADEKSKEPTSQPADETPAPAQPGADTPPPAAKTAPDGKQPEEKKEPQPAAKATDLPKPAEKPPEPEYRPLDDDLRSQIRDELLRVKTRDLMKRSIDEATDRVFSLRNQFITPDETGKRTISHEDIASQLKKYAEEHGLKYQSTDYLSAMELKSGAADSIGTATDPLDGQMNPGSARTLWRRLLQSAPIQLYDPMVVENFLTNDLFAVWKTGDSPDHIPTLDEPGVREQVVTAWKIDRARPDAEKRAGELADLVRESKKGMAEALAGQTVTGKEGEPQITTRLTESFSWLREPTAPSTDFFNRPPPEVSKVAALENISDERESGDQNQFMKVIFDQMEENDIRAIPNRDKSIYYVVQVTERTPSSPVDQEAFRQTFLHENVGPMSATPYQYQMGLQDRRMYGQWVSEFRKEYGVRWTPLGRPAPAM